MNTLENALLIPRPKVLCACDGSLQRVHQKPERVHAPEVPAQGFRLEITPKAIRTHASDNAGFFYAEHCLQQLARQYPDAWPCGVLEDWPDYPVRGFMLDISRDKVPTMDTLFGLIDRLAGLRFNRLELYMEHTFAYANHRAVWENASPMTAEEIRRLDAYCKARCIELVPNQNSLGHFERWLKGPAYQPLAETMGDYTTPWGERRSTPSTLCPTDPASLDLVRELHAELLPNFSSPHVNVGCDEPFELGCGRSREACTARGKGRVYLDYLLKLREAVRGHGRRMQFWGDIITRHPDLIPELPRDLTVLAWGYEANEPSEQHLQLFAQSGIPFYVCPGTSSWRSLAGRTDNAIANIQRAARLGKAGGARGLILTDWGDCGHWQPLAVSYLPMAFGAACAWRADTEFNADFVRVADQHVFHDDARVLAGLARDLGNLYQRLPLIGNGSHLFYLLQADAPFAKKPAITRERLESVTDELDTGRERLASSRMQGPEAPLIAREYQLVMDLVRWACQRGISLLQGQTPVSNDWKSGVVEDFRNVWLARNRPGGLTDSIRVLEAR